MNMSKRMTNAVRLVSLAGVAGLLCGLAGCTTIGEIQVDRQGPVPADQPVMLSISVKASKPVLYKWSTLDGGKFVGSTEFSSAKFLPPNDAKVRVICEVAVGGVPQSPRMKTLDVVITTVSRDGGQTPTGEGDPVVMTDSMLNPSAGLDMGVDDSAHQRDWVKDAADKKSHALYYPGYPPLRWGALFITVGKPTDQNRPGLDYSQFGHLIVTMKGRMNDEVQVGVKDLTQPDTGHEPKQTVIIQTVGWHDYPIDLRNLAQRGTKLNELYVVCELVFAEKPAQVFLKNVRFER
jgi:hypothetical protein